MKNHYRTLPSTKNIAPTTGIHINTITNERSSLRSQPDNEWQGTALDALCSKKLWSILRQQTDKPGAIDSAKENAIRVELIARGDHASASRWRAPH